MFEAAFIRLLLSIKPVQFHRRSTNRRFAANAPTRMREKRPTVNPLKLRELTKNTEGMSLIRISHAAADAAAPSHTIRAVLFGSRKKSFYHHKLTHLTLTFQSATERMSHLSALRPLELSTVYAWVSFWHRSSSHRVAMKQSATTAMQLSSFHTEDNLFFERF
jgi:hypothetical protein